jgi:AraC-like DNA-binding protein
MLGISTLRFFHDIESTCPLHAHDNFEMVYNLPGEGKVVLGDGRTFPIQAHTVTLYKPGVIHKQVMSKPGTDFCLQIDTKHMRQIDSLPAVHHIEVLKSLRLRQEFLSLVKTQCDLASDYAQIVNFRVSALLLELYHVKSSTDNTDTDWRLEKAKSYIEKSFASIASIEEAAEEAGFSPDYFRHQFKATYGISPKEHWLNCQLEHAQRLLLHSPLPQKAIAVQCGLKNIRYFNTRFRHYFGMTPENFRKQPNRTLPHV